MQDRMIEELSSISRTNQIQLSLNPQEVAEKIYQYLWNRQREIEFFTLDYKSSDKENFDKNPHPL
jgi:hypothetical protein